MAGIAIPQDAPAMTRRTLGSLVPHPANIGRVMGTGIAAPKLKLAGGGIAQAENIGQNMFQPINSNVGIPSADINFISSPQLQSGPGAPQAKVAQPQQQPSGIQDFNQTAGAVGSVAGAYNGINSILGSGNGIGAALPGMNMASALDNAMLTGQVNAAAGTPELLSTLNAGTDAAASSAAWYQPAIDAASALFALFADGGAVPHRDEGGEINSLTNSLMRQEARETYHPGGFLNSAGPGRTDTINTNVPTGSYVVPADVVSGLGEGNSLAGSAVIDRMFGTSPYGVRAPQIRRGPGGPKPPSSQPEPPPRGEQPGPTVNTQFINSAGGYAKGGEVPDKAPVVVAGGEHVIPPEAIIKKFGSLKRGHKILDHWTVMERERIIKEMKGLAPPVGSKVKT